MHAVIQNCFNSAVFTLHNLFSKASYMLKFYNKYFYFFISERQKKGVTFMKAEN